MIVVSQFIVNSKMKLKLIEEYWIWTSFEYQTDE